jgi:hypothetical protein
MLKWLAQDPNSRITIGMSDMRSTENGLHVLAKDVLPNGTQLDPGLSNDEYKSQMAFYLLEKPQSELGLSHEEILDVKFQYWIAKKLLPADSQPDLGLDAEQVNLRIVDSFEQWATSFNLATTNRTFFTTEKGFMGLAPIDAQPGDCAAVLYGSALPVILRHDGRGKFYVRWRGLCSWIDCGEAAELAKKGKLDDHQMQGMFTII